MSIESAKFVVQRGAQQFKCQGDQLGSKLQPGDLVAVQHHIDDTASKYIWDGPDGILDTDWLCCTDDDGKTYKVSGDRFKELFIPNGWFPADAAAQQSWYSVTYGAGKFVALSASGTQRVMHSDDGITWKLADAAAQSYWTGITYGDGKFVAVARSGSTKVMYSDNGINWTAASDAGSGIYWEAITYGGDKFVAVGKSGIMWSSDGITWQLASGALTKYLELMDVTYGNGMFIAISKTGKSEDKIHYSYDGIDWVATGRNEAGFIDLELGGVAYGNGMFVAVADFNDSRTHAVYSTNGTEWRYANCPFHSSWFSVDYGAGKFVAVASSGPQRAMYSLDGTEWFETTPAENNGWEEVCWGKDKFVAVAGSGTHRVMYSFTGIGDPS